MDLSEYYEYLEPFYRGTVTPIVTVDYRTLPYTRFLRIKRSRMYGKDKLPYYHPLIMTTMLHSLCRPDYRNLQDRTALSGESDSLVVHTLGTVDRHMGLVYWVRGTNNFLSFFGDNILRNSENSGETENRLSLS